MAGSQTEVRSRVQRAAVAMSNQVGAGRARGAPSRMQRVGDVIAHVQGRAKRAAGVMSRSLGTDTVSGVPRRFVQAAKHLARHAGAKLGLDHRGGFHPARYWPIVMIAVAIAESAHAPLLTGARAAWKNPPALSHAAVAMDRPPASVTGRTDMHAPQGPGHLPPAERRKQVDNGTSPAYFAKLFPPIPGEFTPHSPPISLIHTGGNGLVDPGVAGGGGSSDGGTGGGSGGSENNGGDTKPQVIPHTAGGVINGNDGGGGTGGSGGTGGAGSAGAGGSSNGDVIQFGGDVPTALPTIDPLVNPTVNPATDPVVTAVPEPGSLGVLFAGAVLLGRRRDRRSL